jgi:phosphatidylglycerophosphatase C
MAVVVFDLDHTLIRCDSFAGFNRQLILRSPLRVAATLLVAPVLLLLCVPRRSRIWVGSSLVWLGTVGLTEAQLLALMDEYVEQRFGGQTSLVCQTGVQALLAHLAAGARVFVATGSEARLAARICARLGAADVEVVGSLLRPRWGGWVAHRHCFGGRKLRMLLERGAGESWDCVYTDSAADLPILARGARRIVVNPRPAHHKRIVGTFGQDVEVVEWH